MAGNSRKNRKNPSESKESSADKPNMSKKARSIQENKMLGVQNS
jgi:hypothetical protein